MPVFDVDFNLKSWQFLPVRLRQAVQYAWAKVCVSGVVYMAGVFRGNRTANLYDLAHNGQVCKLQGALNDVFDVALRRIYIDDPAYIDPTYVYRVPELKPLFIDKVSEIGGSVIPAPDPVPLFKRSECYTGGGTQFVVHVPVGLVYDTARMKALIDKYRLASKRVYTIVSP